MLIKFETNDTKLIKTIDGLKVMFEEKTASKAVQACIAKLPELERKLTVTVKKLTDTQSRLNEIEDLLGKRNRIEARLRELVPND